MAEGKRLKPTAVTLNEKSERVRTSDSEQDFGSALRAAYDSAVQEDIPFEMLDLLDKLR